MNTLIKKLIFVTILEIKKVVGKIRAPVMRFLKPKTRYFLFKPKKSLNPISTKYGFDRGLPIDRYYIEKFLKENKKYIKGRVLEVHDNEYTTRFGGRKVKESDVLDIDTSNKAANIYDDLRNLKKIGSDTYDCFIITQTLGVIDRYEAVVKECWRILKPGGTLLVTVSSMGPAWDLKENYWRFTSASLKYLFSKHFPKRNLKVNSYGNVLSGQGYWVGLSTEEFKKSELDYNDPHFPIIVTLRVTEGKQS